MIKKILVAVAFMAVFCASRADAYVETYDKGYSTWTVTSVLCTTGTPVDLSAFPLVAGSTSVAGAITGSTTALKGFNNVLYRFTNPNSQYEVFFGPDANVSLSSTSANAAERMLGNVSSSQTAVSYSLGYNPVIGINAQVFCIAQPSAGTMGVRLIRAVFGYK